MPFLTEYASNAEAGGGGLWERQNCGTNRVVLRATRPSWRALESTTLIFRALSTTRTIKMSDVAERVKKIVVEHLGVEPEKVVDNANFIDDLGADSLDTVELVMAFEEEFGVEIPDDAAETIVTVGDAVRFLEKNKKS